MDVRTVMTESGLTAELVGTLDADTEAAASATLEKYVSEHRPTLLILDLGKLAAVDAVGLRTLARWRAGGPHEVRLVNVPASVSDQLSAVDS